MEATLNNFKNIHSQLWPAAKQQSSLIMCDTGKDDAVMLCCADTHDHTLNITSLVTFGGNVNSMRTCNNTKFILSRINCDKEVSFHEYSGDVSHDASSVHGASGLGHYTVEEIDALANQKPSCKVDYHQLAQQILATKKIHNIISTGPLTGVDHLFKALVQESHGNQQLLNAALNKLRVIIMGGVLDYRLGNRGDAEFNFHLDPKATQNTFKFINQNKINAVLVPLDLTHQCVFQKNDFDHLEFDKTAKERIFFNLFKQHAPLEKGVEPAHDVHTVTCLINPEQYKGEFRKITAEKTGKILQSDEPSSVFVLRELDAKGFKNTLFASLNAG